MLNWVVRWKSSETRGASSAASASNALVDHVRSLVTPGAIHSVAVKSNGHYGFDANVWAGMPVKTTGAPINMPVGKEVLGRIMNVVGQPVDELMLRRLKKKKLALRDQIARLENLLDPAEPA